MDEEHKIKKIEQNVAKQIDEYSKKLLETVVSHSVPVIVAVNSMTNLIIHLIHQNNLSNKTEFLNVLSNCWDIVEEKKNEIQKKSENCVLRNCKDSQDVV